MKQLAYFCILLPCFLNAQVGDKFNFSSLQLINNARSAALGSATISLSDGDLLLFYDNPAVLDSVKPLNVGFMLNPYFADINAYAAAASFQLKGQRVGIGFNLLDYGKFEERNTTGVLLNNFPVLDYNLTAGTAHTLGPFTLGINIKYARNTIGDYHSDALLCQLGGLFRVSPQWTFGLVIKNLGWILSNSSQLSNPKLPIDVSIGTSFEPKHMPIRFTLTSNQLLTSNVILSNNDDNTNLNIEKVLRKINIGMEILLSKRFNVLVGYNHKRRQELKLENISSSAGLSYGCVIKIHTFVFRFSRTAYHAAGGVNFFSIQTDLSSFKKIL